MLLASARMSARSADFDIHRDCWLPEFRRNRERDEECRRRLAELDAVSIARREIAGRHHFYLANELFRLLTWDAMLPEHSEEAMETGGNGAARRQFRGCGAHAGKRAEAVRGLVGPKRS